MYFCFQLSCITIYVSIRYLLAITKVRILHESEHNAPKHIYFGCKGNKKIANKKKKNKKSLIS